MCLNIGDTSITQLAQAQGLTISRGIDNYLHQSARMPCRMLEGGGASEADDDGDSEDDAEREDWDLSDPDEPGQDDAAAVVTMKSEPTEPITLKERSMKLICTICKCKAKERS